MRTRRWVALLVGLTAAGAVPNHADAHPLGNLTVNTSAQIVIAAETTTISYVLDLAELPTVQEQPQIDAEGDQYAANKCASMLASVTLRLDGEVTPLDPTTTTSTLLPGQGGLSTVRVECTWLAPTGEASEFTWTDDNFVDRIGWREVTLIGDGMTVTSPLPTASPSSGLTNYPTDVAAPRQLTGSGTFVSGGPRLAAAETAVGPTDGLEARGADGLTQRFNRLIGEREMTWGIASAAIVLAFVLGALHSLAPGHGKTLMAAMVASRRGTVRQVVTVGATVATTHTIGVVVLGVIVTTSQVIAPDRVLPWLTILSGALLLATGAWLLARRLTGKHPAGHHHHGVFGSRGHVHPHSHPHPHPHPHLDHDHHDHDHDHHGDHHGHDHHGDHDHGHDHGHDHHGDHGNGHGHGHGHGHDEQELATVGGGGMTRDDQPLRTRSLALIGMAGGMVPTPSALVVLLGAAALGRAWFGVLLVGVYGIGMAATLLVAGYALVRLQGWLERQYAEARWLNLGLRVLPVLTAAGLIVGGLGLAVRGAISV